MIVPEKPSLDELTHHGVKGMKWGVRKAYVPHPDKSGGGSNSKAPIASGDSKWKTALANHKQNQPELTRAQKLKNISEAEKKFDAKSDPPKAERKPLTPGQKRAIKVAIGVGVGAAILGYGAYTGTQPLGIYQNTKRMAKANAWGTANHVQESSFNRPELHLPAGHEFTRISKAAEKGWHGGTYTSHNAEDYNRYLGDAFGTHSDALGHPAELYKITFKAKETIKIPDLTTTLDVFKQSMEESWHQEVGVPRTFTSKEVLREYNKRAGGSWDDPTSQKLFENLSKKGYHGIIDEMDAGTYADSPLVLFKHTSVTAKKSVKITPQEIKQARKAILPIKDPKLPEPQLSKYAQKVATMRSKRPQKVSA